jgi:signal transduction histidine kinase
MLSTFDHSLGREAAGFALNLDRGHSAEGHAIREVTLPDRAHRQQTVAQVSDLIAHDFNNLIQVVKSALHIVERRDHGASSDLTFVLKQALQSADKAAAITHRLLALTEPAIANPQPLLCSVAVRSMDDLLRSVLGHDIALEFMLSNELLPISCDLRQFENAIINLAINAKAAMPNGGTLRIETYAAELAFERGGLERGRYNALSITDTGRGMTQDVARRAFDLFYSADPAGKGEGLGLSAVKAFVEQCKGHVQIASAPGCGTSVRLYLPSHP